MLPGALAAGYTCVRPVEHGLEGQTDETMKPPPSSFVRAGSKQDSHYLYTRFA